MPGPELLDERVVGGHDLAAVESRLLRPERGLREGLDELFNLRAGHRVAAVLIVHGGQAGRRPARLEREIEVAVRADVVELLDHHRAVLVAGIGDPAKVRDHAVVAVAEVAPGKHRGAVDRHRFDHDHRRPAQGPLDVVAEVAFGGEALGAHVGGMGAEVQAMLERYRAHLEGAEEVREGRCRGHVAFVLAPADVAAGSGGAHGAPGPWPLGFAGRRTAIAPARGGDSAGWSRHVREESGNGACGDGRDAQDAGCGRLSSRPAHRARQAIASPC